MLLLGEPAFDYRVAKEAGTLVAAGYVVTIVCLPPDPRAGGPAQVGGATVIRRAAPRPLRMLARLRRARTHTRPEGGEQPGSRGPAEAPRQARGKKFLREARALVGTLWLNLVLARVAARVPADYIHAHDLDALWAGKMTARRVQARLIYDAHELYPDMLAHSSQLYNGFWRLIEHRLIRHARAVITVNRVLAIELRNRHRLPHLPAVVMNCPPLSPPPPPLERGDGTIGMLYLGALLPERGLEGLLQALPHVDPRVILHVRGSGPLRSWLDAQATIPGLQGRLIMHDPVPAERLAATLAGMAIGVIPYVATSLNNYLCSPNKLFDYFMGGLAVVASDLPEVRRDLVRRGAGLLYGHDDPTALADAINSLATDPARLRAFQRSARLAAEEEFHWANQAHVLLETYRMVTP
ncbi:MAG TPA: glycosyltransferase [Chloroflexota bacterium]|nr:glycosyltransferase [Chloroflexota bacterium]